MSDLRPITAESEFKPLADLTTRFNKLWVVRSVLLVPALPLTLIAN